jgi:hypothetical protein
MKPTLACQFPLPLAVSLLLGPLAFQEPAHDCEQLTELDRSVQKVLTGVELAGSIYFFYAPGELTPEQLQAAVASNTADFERLEKKLAMQYAGHVHIFLYLDGEDMLVKAENDNGCAFATGSSSIHQVQDFRGPHELTHLFALQFPPVEDGSDPDGFVVEGLATAMNETELEISVHDWAAVYLRTRRLPDLPDLRNDWMEEEPDRFHPYLVAGSFLGYLVESHGIDKVKTWYVSSTEAYRAFGRSFPGLEQDWRSWLARRETSDAAAQRVLSALGLRKKAPVLSTGPEQDLLAGGTLDALQPEDASRWRMRDGVLVGEHDGPWTALLSRQTFGPDVGLRARLRLRSGDAVQLRLNASGGRANEGIFANWATYIVSGANDHGSDSELQIPDGIWSEVVFVNQGGRGRLYLNGLLAIESEFPLLAEKGAVGVCLERGVVEIAELSVFQP